MAEPELIDEGRVAQVLVRYRGPANVSFTVTGTASGRPYHFDGHEDRFRYVQTEDLQWLALRPDLEIVAGSAIDPRAVERERDLERLRAQLREELLQDAGPPTDRSPPQPKRSGGRPRVALQDDQLAWHLRHHELSHWTNARLAEYFSRAGSGLQPRSIAKRLERFAQRYPELIDEDACPHCRPGNELPADKDDD